MGFKDIPITSVFTAAILAGYPFLEVPGGLEKCCGTWKVEMYRGYMFLYGLIADVFIVP